MLKPVYKISAFPGCGWIKAIWSVTSNTVYYGDSWYSEGITQHNKIKKVKLGHKELKVVKLAECAFVDKLMICAEHEEKL